MLFLYKRSVAIGSILLSFNCIGNQHFDKSQYMWAIVERDTPKSDMNIIFAQPNRCLKIVYKPKDIKKEISNNMVTNEASIPV